MDDKTGMTETLKTLLGVEGVGQQIAMDYRVADIFMAVMRKLGFDDIQEFRTFAQEGGLQNMNVEFMPDEQLQQQVAVGNQVPTAAA